MLIKYKGFWEGSQLNLFRIDACPKITAGEGAVGAPFLGETVRGNKDD